MEVGPCSEFFEDSVEGGTNMWEEDKCGAGGNRGPEFVDVVKVGS